jgi:hypothetical protein
MINVAPSIVANYLSRNQQKPEDQIEPKPKKPGCGEEGCENGFIEDGDVSSMCKKCNGKGNKFNK